MTRAAGDNGTSTRECPRAPVKLTCVARHDAHVLNVHTERVGNELRENGKVTLSLRTHTGRAADLSAGLNRHTRSLVGTNASPFDVARHGDADMPAFGP